MLDALIVNATNSNPPSLNCGLFVMGWRNPLKRCKITETAAGWMLAIFLPSTTLSKRGISKVMKKYGIFVMAGWTCNILGLFLSQIGSRPDGLPLFAAAMMLFTLGIASKIKD